MVDLNFSFRQDSVAALLRKYGASVVSQLYPIREGRSVWGATETERDSEKEGGENLKREGERG